MYLLDTNICVAVLKNNPNAAPTFLANSQRCYLSSIVVAELYKGVYWSQRCEENRHAIDRFVSLLPVLNYDRAAALEFGKIQGELKKIGRPTGEFDALVASVARSRQLILVTDNTKHFQHIPNLALENWLRS